MSCCPHSRERSPTLGGAILTKAPLRPLLNRNAIGTGRLQPLPLRPLPRRVRRLSPRDLPDNNATADLLRAHTPPISTRLTHPPLGLSNLPVARPARPRFLIRSRPAELSLPIRGHRCQSGARWLSPAGRSSGLVSAGSAAAPEASPRSSEWGSALGGGSVCVSACLRWYRLVCGACP